MKHLRQECVDADVRFTFYSTGRRFIKDGKTYHLESARLRSEQAYKSGMNYPGRPIHFHLHDIYGRPVCPEDLYHPHFRPICQTCSMRQSCNGCAGCAHCTQETNP